MYLVLKNCLSQFYICLLLPYMLPTFIKTIPIISLHLLHNQIIETLHDFYMKLFQNHHVRDELSHELSLPLFHPHTTNRRDYLCATNRHGNRRWNNAPWCNWHTNGALCHTLFHNNNITANSSDSAVACAQQQRRDISLRCTAPSSFSGRATPENPDLCQWCPVLLVAYDWVVCFDIFVVLRGESCWFIVNFVLSLIGDLLK